MTATKVAPARATSKAAPAKAAAKSAPAKAAAKSAASTPAASAPAKKAAATTASKATATKAAATKTTATKAAPAKKAAAKKAPAKKAPATEEASTPSAAPKEPAAAPAGSGPATQNSSDLNAADLAEIRARLQDELTEMQLEYDRSMSQLDELTQSQDGAGDDQADAGSKAFEREQEQSIAANRHLLIVQIQHAIERIDSGTYGVCEDCGKPIPKARLKALPMATLDADCKARAERH
ncbi:TraR/DksA family transcriptional regulator [Jatrophihabitans sp.]|uniref:TraR/DksA family transcriptional regulator n=1 Tax=Jatrophihabitans sp. TaxID=1932789 RepID=UPI002BF38402|nr:TraR/DksA family transcriptional regulator [Jatrophihabitans sp.]